jgi:hypothetical protein
MQREDVPLAVLLLLKPIDNQLSGKPLPNASLSERAVQDKSYTLF